MVSEFDKDQNDALASKNNVDRILTRQRCLDCGVSVISISGDGLVLAAMNPSFPAVLDLSYELKSLLSIPIDVVPISSSDWEKRMDDSELTSLASTSHYDSDDIILNKEDSGHTPVPAAPLPSINKPNLVVENGLEDLAGQVEDTSLLFDALFDSSGSDQLEDVDDELLDEVSSDSNSDPVVFAVSTILMNCRKLKASDIHIEPQEDCLRVRYRIDGLLKQLYSVPKSKASSVISRIKILSKLDIAEKRLPQDGRIRCKLDGLIEDFRVSTLPGKWGEKIVLRTLQSDSSILNLEKLITDDQSLKLIRELGQSPYGILIVVGPTGSGKSTTLYSILSERNTSDVNISTVEDPVEYTLDGIHQVQVIREKGLDFARALRALMRQDPDIILVGETRDRETAQTAMEAALTGHMVFTTLHANDTATAITRLAEMGVPPYLVGASVVGVMAQRLVRRVCPVCSSLRPTEPGKDDMAIRNGIKQVRVACLSSSLLNNSHSPKPCTECNGSGYKGRLGLYEVMPITDPLREQILRNSTADILRNTAYEQGMRSLLEYGLDLVNRQLTTLEEVERVCFIDEPTDD